MYPCPTVAIHSCPSVHFYQCLYQLMANWWFGSRWFGILGIPLSNNPYPNHQPKPTISHWLTMFVPFEHKDIYLKISLIKPHHHSTASAMWGWKIHPKYISPPPLKTTMTMESNDLKVYIPLKMGDFPLPCYFSGGGYILIRSLYSDMITPEN